MSTRTQPYGPPDALALAAAITGEANAEKRQRRPTMSTMRKAAGWRPSTFALEHRTRLQEVEAARLNADNFQGHGDNVRLARAEAELDRLRRGRKRVGARRVLHAIRVYTRAVTRRDVYLWSPGYTSERFTTLDKRASRAHLSLVKLVLQMRDPE